MKNGYPMWKDLWQQRSLWYENGKWKVGYLDIEYGDESTSIVDSTSNTFEYCPELVGSWSSFFNYGGTSSVEIICRTAIKSGKYVLFITLLSLRSWGLLRAL